MGTGARIGGASEESPRRTAARSVASAGGSAMPPSRGPEKSIRLRTRSATKRAGVAQRGAPEWRKDAPRKLSAPGLRGKVESAEPRKAYAAQGRAWEKKEMDAGDRTIERLKFVLGAEGWKAFMAELTAARGRGRGIVVEKWLAVARTKQAGKLAEHLRAEAKAKADAEELQAQIEKQRQESET